MEPTKSSPVVLLSGGVDSAACVAFFRSQGRSPHAIFVDYGQAARVPEWTAAQAVAKHYEIPLTRLTIEGLSSGTGEIQGRNLLLLSLGVVALRATASALVIGIHAGTPYFDCSPPFLSSIGRLVAECTGGQVQVIAPLLEWSKRQIFDYCVANAVPVALTYSCESGSIPGCGECLSCGDRARLEGR